MLTAPLRAYCVSGVICYSPTSEEILTTLGLPSNEYLKEVHAASDPIPTKMSAHNVVLRQARPWHKRCQERAGHDDVCQTSDSSRRMRREAKMVRIPSALECRIPQTCCHPPIASAPSPRFSPAG